MKNIIRLLLIIFVLASGNIWADNIEIKNSHNLPKYIVQELLSIGRDSSEDSMTISSKQRSVKKQVEIMLDYYIYCHKGDLANRPEQCGIELVRKVYHMDCHGGFDSFSPTASRDENIKNMTQALTKSLKKLGESRTCMNHVVIPGIRTKYVAVDIKPSSIGNHRKFYQAVISNPKVKRFYYPYIKGVPTSPVKDSAFHIEFYRDFDNAN